MRKIAVTGTLPIEQEEAWEYFADIQNYPKRVTFLKKIILIDEVGEGGTWFDVTSILWIPAKVKHETTIFLPPKQIGFEVFVPGGKMFHMYSVTGAKHSAKVTAEIRFVLHPFIDIFMGSILQKRLTVMLESTLDNMKKELAEKQNITQ